MEIYAYGEIGAEVKAAEFTNLTGEVVVHINSAGGSLTEAVAIFNLLKAHGAVEVTIDGLCGSAATVIAFAGKHISMASNALMMIHLPIVKLNGNYTEEELTSMKKSLAAATEILKSIYKTRRIKVELDLDKEIWLTATEAQSLGLIDEITSAVDEVYDESRGIIILNNVRAQIGTTRNIDNRAEIVSGERRRIINLMKLKGDNAAIDAVIDVAIQDGDDFGKIEKYVNAIKAANEAPENRVGDIITDNINSGAGNVMGDIKTEKPNYLRDYLKQRLGAIE